MPKGGETRLAYKCSATGGELKIVYFGLVASGQVRTAEDAVRRFGEGDDAVRKLAAAGDAVRKLVGGEDAVRKLAEAEAAVRKLVEAEVCFVACRNDVREKVERLWGERRPHPSPSYQDKPQGGDGDGAGLDVSHSHTVGVAENAGPDR